MSVSYRAKTILGIEIKRSDLLAEAGRARRCTNCDRNFEGVPGRFCPDDGGEIRIVIKEEPIQKLKDLAKEMGEEEDLFEALFDDLPAEEIFGEFGLMAIDSMQYEDEHRFAIGKVIGETESSNGGDRRKTCSYSIDDIKQEAKELEAFVHGLGLKGEAKIFTCLCGC